MGIPNGDPTRWVWGGFEWEFLPSNEALNGGSFTLNSNTTSNANPRRIAFHSNRVVPTGKENAPRTLTVLYWRLISRQ
jgi:hypothetical protein